MKTWQLGGALAVALALIAGTNAQAMTLGKTNLVNLVRDADSIVIGSVSNMTDGVDERGLPYTEITLTLEETLRGNESGTYTFRQIGLLNPRLTDDGSAMMLAAPDGMPKFGMGERVLLFLSPQAQLTGLRTTVGLGMGKFTLNPGSAENQASNAGIFQSVSLAPGLATPNDSRILSTTIGAVNDVDPLSLVRRAVSEAWVDACNMWDTDETGTCTPPTSHGRTKPSPVKSNPMSRPASGLAPSGSTRIGIK